MQFDIRGAAAMMNVPESTIRRWVIERDLPATGVEGRYRFGRTDLLEWATSHDVEISPELFYEDTIDSEPLLLADALEAGGIFYDVPGADAKTVLCASWKPFICPRASIPARCLSSSSRAKRWVRRR